MTLSTKMLVILASTIFVANAVCQANDDLEKGKTIYNGIGACASCHGPTGNGDGVAAAALNPKPRKFSEGVFAFDTDGDGQTGTAADLFNVVTNGAAKYNGSMLMAGRPDIPEEDRKALVQYVLSLSTK